MPHVEGARSQEPALIAEGLCRRFGSLQALAGLSFQVAQGELYGLVGPDGAGKTTTLRALSGLLLPDSGRARVFGRDPSDSRVRERLGLMPQQYSLYGDLSVLENLTFFARLNALPRAVFKARAERLLAITRLERFVDRRAGALSGGMYKKLALSCALLHEPDVLLLDEPTNGVDPVSRRELWSLLYEFVERGMTILISTPYMDEAERCHRVGLLDHGQLLLEGRPPQLQRSLHGEAYAVSGGEREQVQQLLERLPVVLAQSPVGARVRVVVVAGQRGPVEQALAACGATLEPTAPSFEDVYLSRLHEVAQTRAASANGRAA
jgi:ABC-2 type transport system ATP-binding protein